MPRASFSFDCVFNDLTDGITVNNRISTDSGLPLVEKHGTDINTITLIKQYTREYNYIEENLINISFKK